MNIFWCCNVFAAENENDFLEVEKDIAQILFFFHVMQKNQTIGKNHKASESYSNSKVECEYVVWMRVKEIHENERKSLKSTLVPCL